VDMRAARGYVKRGARNERAGWMTAGRRGVRVGIDMLALERGAGAIIYVRWPQRRVLVCVISAD
jgi:hypothetical protein